MTTDLAGTPDPRLLSAIQHIRWALRGERLDSEAFRDCLAVMGHRHSSLYVREALQYLLNDSNTGFFGSARFPTWRVMEEDL